MRRKILRVGQSSMAVSLPSAWVKAKRLKAGQEVEVQESDGRLVVSSGIVPAHKEATIIVPSADLYANRLVNSPYIQGCDVIHVRFSDPKVRQKVQDGIQELMGCDLFDQRRDSLTIKVIAEAKSEEFDSVFQRMLHLNREIMEELAHAIRAGDRRLLEPILAYEGTMNKLNIFCKRLLNNSPERPTSEITALYTSSGYLEEIADHLKHINLFLQEQQRGWKGFVGELERTIAIHDEVAKLCHKPNVEGMARLKQTIDVFKKGLLARMHARKDLGYAYGMLHTIVDNYRSIAEQLRFA